MCAGSTVSILYLVQTDCHGNEDGLPQLPVWVVLDLTKQYVNTILLKKNFFFSPFCVGVASKD